jgi:hypothetical protein
MDLLLGFLIGVAFGVTVVPAIVLWRRKQREFVMHHGEGSAKDAKETAIASLLAEIKAVKPEEVKALAVSIRLYDKPMSFVGLGGTVEDLEESIAVMLHKLGENIAIIEESCKN